MDLQSAKDITGMACREMPVGKHDFLTCQIGKIVPTKIQISVYRHVIEQVFHLKAHGSTWEKAVENWEKRKATT